MEKGGLDVPSALEIGVARASLKEGLPYRALFIRVGGGAESRKYHQPEGNGKLGCTGRSLSWRGGA